MTTKSRIVDPLPGTSSLVRPTYSQGLLLNDDDLTAAVDYTRNLSRLLFRSLFGCGVICGLRVIPDFKCGKLFIEVKEGIALDCRGDPLHVPGSRTIVLDPECGVDIPDPVWIALCRHDKCCAPRTAMCSCDDTESPSVCTRIREGYELRVLPTKPPCSCGCAGKASSKDPARQGDPGEPKGVAAYVESGSKVLVDTGADDGPPQDCWCADPKDPCYHQHYLGECACECGEDCDCDCIVLARITGSVKDGFTADHSVRRFIRPVLMRDPVVYEEQHRKTTTPQTAREYAQSAERAARDAATKSQKAARLVSKAAADADKASTEAQAAAAASAISRTQAMATTKAVAEAAAVAAADKPKQARQPGGTGAGEGGAPR